MYSSTAALDSIGCIRRPDDPDYAGATTPWNLAIRQRPLAVAVPRSIPDVVEVVTYAVKAGLRIAPQSTGHLAAALTDTALDDLLLLRLHELTGVDIDPGTRTARVLGGTPWRDVIAAAAAHGLTALHGTAGSVAVAGYVLGGGLSFYGRQHGLAAGSVRAMEMVTAAGELVRASVDEHPALFWALRGGGGSFGTVVAIELELLPIRDVYAGMLLWDLDQAPRVLRAWVESTAAFPESAGTAIRLMRFPALPALPPFLRGRKVVVVDGVVLEDDERASGLLAPLRALSPEIDTFGRVPAAALLDVHMDPPVPTAGVSDHCMLEALPEAAVSALLEVAGPDVETPVMLAELRHLGGALARPRDAALSHLRGQYALLAMAAAPTPELEQGGTVATSAVTAALRPWSNGLRYANFAERPGVAVFDRATAERLVDVRDAYDPHRVWVAAHSI